MHSRRIAGPRLTGDIPDGFVHPDDMLWSFGGGNDGLCMPDTEAFLEWRDGLLTWDGPMCEDDEDEKESANEPVCRSGYRSAACSGV